MWASHRSTRENVELRFSNCWRPSCKDVQSRSCDIGLQRRTIRKFEEYKKIIKEKEAKKRNGTNDEIQ
jgi:hypothetical protein